MSNLGVTGAGNGAVPEPQGSKVERSKDEKSPASIYIAAQDIDSDGTVTGEEILKKERISNFTFSEKILDEIKNFSIKYDKFCKDSMEAVQAQVEKFIDGINTRITELGKQNLKKETADMEAAYGEGSQDGLVALASYNDIAGNRIIEQYNKNGELIDKTIQPPKTEE